MSIKMMLLKLRLKLFPRLAGKYDFNKILRASGIEVGDHTIFYDPNSMSIDRERPWMLHIGDYCKITKGTVILTHDYSRSVLRRFYGEIIGEAGETIIGNNVFIGMNSVILMGSKIGDNVIIGAGSVVTGEIPSNCVAAGNPCHVIHTLDEHYKKRKAHEIQDATIYYNSFCEKYSREPTIKEMGPFFWLFMKRNLDALEKEGISLSLGGDDKLDIADCFMKSIPRFNGYDEFKNSIGSQDNSK